MATTLHSTQRALLKLLKDNIDDPLTMRELQDELELSSPSLVLHHIRQLEKKRYLKRNPSDPQDYQILKGRGNSNVTYLNLYGMAKCGPGGSILEGKPLDRIAMSTKLIQFPAEDAFMVEAEGDSMQPVINEGSFVIARKVKGDVRNGSVVVCVNNGEVLIKRYHKTEDATLLESFNTDYPAMAASRDDFRIEGVVEGVVASTIS